MSNSRTHGSGISRRERIDRIFEKMDFLMEMREVIGDLPESQQQLYRDYFEAGHSQAEMARMYNISPQAVAYRLKKFKNTVKKKMETDYGYTEEDVMKFIDAESFESLLV